MKSAIKIALAGKPNSGKSSLFNLLTGLRQKVGNFTGVTVDRASGLLKGQTNLPIQMIDLPGTYSLYPRSADEQVTFDILTEKNHPDHPEKVVVVADATNLRNCLLLCTQLIDLGLPVVLAVNMMDLLPGMNLSLNLPLLSEKLGIPVVGLSARKNSGIQELKQTMTAAIPLSVVSFLSNSICSEVSSQKTPFVYGEFLKKLQTDLHTSDIQISDKADLLKIKDLLHRYETIDELLKTVVQSTLVNPAEKRNWADRILLHPIGGYAIFLLMLLFIFQAIFSWASLPMDWIEWGMGNISSVLTEHIAESWGRSLLINGILAGVTGIIIFIPQIAFLFLFMAVLEESGYMARVVFLMDRLMRPFGMNGRSVIPLIGGMACAIPSIMGARTIADRRERLVTILVTPLMSCSARIPVYTLLISMVIPPTPIFGFFQLQGLVMMGLYLLGFFMALLSALVLKSRIRKGERSIFLVELPAYRFPEFRNISLTLWHKCKAFVWEAGRVILVISMILWGMVNFGPQGEFNKIEEHYSQLRQLESADLEQLQREEAADKLKGSWAGKLGSKIEPLVKPLGFDWKIGIGLITSFAAREVFVGTMATLYAAEEDGSSETLRERMLQDTFSDTGKKVYTPATGISLILFYAFAMQCMSTLAITRRETGSWKWPIVMIVYMSLLAYLAALIPQLIVG